MNSRSLSWGERHLYGNYFTIKICTGTELKDAIKDDLKKHNIDLDIYETNSSSCKIGVRKFIISGVLKHKEYLKYIEIKNRAKAFLLIKKATYHIDVANNMLESSKNIERYEKSINLADPENVGLSV